MHYSATTNERDMGKLEPFAYYMSRMQPWKKRLLLSVANNSFNYIPSGAQSAHLTQWKQEMEHNDRMPQQKQEIASIKKFETSSNSSGSDFEEEHEDISAKRGVQKKRRGGKPKKELTRDQIVACFHLPQHLAAKKLQVSLSTLKRRFYEMNFGLKRWPYTSNTTGKKEDEDEDVEESADEFAEQSVEEDDHTNDHSFVDNSSSHRDQYSYEMAAY